MDIHKHNNSQWRQNWELMVEGKHTNEFFRTWHDSDDEACTFISEYFAKFGGKLPHTYYRPFNQPALRPNLDNEPKGTFVKAKAITLAPI